MSVHASDLDYAEVFNGTFKLIHPTDTKSQEQKIPTIVIDSEPSWRPIPIIVEDKIEITELSDENESSNEQLEFNESYMKVSGYFILLI